MKLCKDCKHVDQEFGYLVCNAPENIISEVSVVTGKTDIRRHWNSCDVHRSKDGFFAIRALRQCGKSGRWFEERDA